MKQKQDVIERKMSLSATPWKGRNMDSINHGESYEEQLKTIDERIAQIMAEQAKQQAENKKKPKMLNQKPKKFSWNWTFELIIVYLNIKRTSDILKTKVDEMQGLKPKLSLKARGSSPSAKEFIANKETRLQSYQKPPQPYCTNWR